jgi:hypothetical protein
MATYDDIYPDAPKNFTANRHDKQPPVVKFDYAEAQDRDEDPKCICGARTSWVNPAAMQYVCSTECNTKIWDNLITAFVGQLIAGAF